MSGSVFSTYPKCTVPLFGSDISRLYCQFRQTPDEYSENCKSRNKKVEADAFVIAYHDRCVRVYVCARKRRGATKSLMKHCKCISTFYHTTFISDTKINPSILKLKVWAALSNAISLFCIIEINFYGSN